jgi:hypothetical protein
MFYCQCLQAHALRAEFEGNKELVRRKCATHTVGMLLHRYPAEPGPDLLPPNVAMQSDREQIRKTLEHGEELIARFRHWEPIISECATFSAVLCLK